MTQQYTEMHAPQVLQLAQKHAKSDWVIWAGAGISHLEPASLPLGKELTLFVLDTLFGNDFTDLAKGLDELLEDALDQDKELGWLTYTSMSAKLRPMVLKYMTNPTKLKISSSERDRIRKAERLAELLGSRPLNRVTYIRQPATALRFVILFRAILDGRANPTLEAQILRLYSEASDVQGYVCAYRDFAIQRFLTAKYHRDIPAFKRADQMINKSLSLAKLVGDVPGTRWARYAKAYFFVTEIVLRMLFAFGPRKS